MQKLKGILKHLLFPPITLIIIFITLSVFALIYSFTATSALPTIQYISYAFSAYSLTIACCRMPNLVKRIKTFTENNSYFLKYKTDARLRVKISLYINTTTNCLFSAFHFLIGIVYQSIWAYSLAVYYVILSVMRYFLLRDTGKNLERGLKFQWKRYRVCGMFLILINLALAYIVFSIVRQNNGFSYHFIYTIGLAVFTFLITTMAIINVIRYRKYGQPIFLAVKYVSLVSALVSMLSLETAMLSAFGSADTQRFTRIITPITGAFVCILTLTMGIYMVIHSSKQLKKFSLEKSKDN